VTLEFRAASSFASDELAALFNEAYADYLVPMRFDEETMRFMVRTFDLDLDAGLVAVEAGNSVGIVNLGVRGDRGWIGGLGVVPSARRRGVGRELMDAVHEQARTRGIRRISLEVIEANEPAFRLYEELGYEMTRWLEIGSLEANGDAASADEQPWEQAHARIRELRATAEPWQRDDETLRHYDDLRGLVAESGATVFRVSGNGVTLMQFAGDDAAAGEVLGSLRREGTVSLFNVPAGDALLTAAKALGGQTTLRQREMVIDLPV
jgi:ribosomal protein S18 acetylase RimI-like enzyme